MFRTPVIPVTMIMHLCKLGIVITSESYENHTREFRVLTHDITIPCTTHRFVASSLDAIRGKLDT